MKKIFIILFGIVIYGCSGYEFVYNKNPKIKTIENQTNYIVTGDQVALATNQISQMLGSNNYNGKYFLFINLSTEKKAIAIAKDASASKIEINYEIAYSLHLKVVNKLGQISSCEVFQKQISSNSFYNPKSEGYSFSTTITEQASIEKNIESNIRRFINLFAVSENSLECKNDT